MPLHMITLKKAPSDGEVGTELEDDRFNYYFSLQTYAICKRFHGINWTG